MTESGKFLERIGEQRKNETARSRGRAGGRRDERWLCRGSARRLLGDLAVHLGDDGAGLLERDQPWRAVERLAFGDEMKAAVAPRSLMDLRDARGGRQRMRCPRGGSPGREGEGYCAGCHVSTFLRGTAGPGPRRRLGNLVARPICGPSTDGLGLAAGTKALLPVGVAERMRDRRSDRRSKVAQAQIPESVGTPRTECAPVRLPAIPRKPGKCRACVGAGCDLWGSAIFLASYNRTRYANRSDRSSCRC